MRSCGVTSRGFAVLFILLVGATVARGGAGDQAPTQCDPAVRSTGTRAEGLRLGCHAVGFELIRGLDRRRRINRDEGTRIGIAVWYPAKPPENDATALTGMEYRLLERSTPPSGKERQTLEAEEVDMLVGWRHAGIVALTPAQAKASIETRGIAVQGAVAEHGRFPVVVVLGGPYYLSTTAEVLASHGLLAIAPFRFDDQSNELEGGDFRQYVENSLGDAEWALEELRQDPRADLRAVTALGHGGGGMQAMLLAMRNRSVTSVVNIDAGNFSKRSEPERNAFYGPRLMRVPYLYIVTAETLKGQDCLADFVAMQFSERTEVVLGADDIRHHDLSDIGRAVTMPMRLRGGAQAVVEKTYAGVQEMVVRFIAEQSSSRESTPLHLADWFEQHKSADNLTVTGRPGIEPAPTLTAAVQSLSDTTLASLKEARHRDPEAPIFQEHSMHQLVTAALDRSPRVAEPLAEFALSIHPASAVLLAQASEVALGAGDRSAARERARSCASLKVDADWQASIAVTKCTALLQRLQSADGLDR
jgi:hypothetical protein